MDIASEDLLAETEPPKILPRILTRFDMVALFFAIIFGTYGAGQLAASGWAGIPMLFLALITFLLPCGLAAYELGTLFPSEGGVYVWAHKAFGPLQGFIAGWLSWMPIFLLLPLDATIIVSHFQYVFGANWNLELQVAIQILVVWILLSIAVLRLRVSQTMINIMFFGAILTAIAALVAGLVHIPAATSITSEIFSFNLGKYGFLYSAAVLWLLGVEIPFNMSAEFGDHKRTGRTMLIWGTLALFLGYIMGIVGILLTTPVAQINQTTGVAQAVATLSPILGLIVAVLIALSVFAQSASTMNSYSRLPFIGGIEKKLPHGMAKVSEKTKSPWPAMLVQAIGASIVILVFSTLTQLVVIYNLYLAALVAIWCASLFYIYFGLLRVRSTHKALYEKRGKEVWKIPGGTFGLWLCCGIGAIFNALAIYYVFATPWVGGISNHSWDMWLGLISVFIIIAGVIVYYGGKRKAA